MIKDQKYCGVILGELAKQTKTELGPIGFKVYMESLAKHDWGVVAKALESCFLDLRRFPTVLEIEAKLGVVQPDEKDEANEIVARCVEAIRLFGYARPKEAAEYIGEIGWAAIHAIGTWDSFTETRLDDMNTTRAQLRDMCKAKRAMASVGRLELPSVKRGEIGDARSEILTLAEGIMKNGN